MTVRHGTRFRTSVPKRVYSSTPSLLSVFVGGPVFPVQGEVKKRARTLLVVVEQSSLDLPSRLHELMAIMRGESLATDAYTNPTSETSTFHPPGNVKSKLRVVKTASSG